jgi:hypothetical protein
LLLVFPHSFFRLVLHLGVVWTSDLLPCVVHDQPSGVFLFL